MTTIVCRNELWHFGESLEKDGSRLIWFNEVECEGPQYSCKFRLEKYKAPKITRKRKTPSS